ITNGFHAPRSTLLRAHAPALRPRAHEQTNGRYPAFCSVAPRLLAAAAVATFPWSGAGYSCLWSEQDESIKAAPGENTLLRSGGDRQRDHFPRSKKLRRIEKTGGDELFRCSKRERLDRLLPVFGQT